jgi:hypothetical protein
MDGDCKGMIRQFWIGGGEAAAGGAVMVEVGSLRNQRSRRYCAGPICPADGHRVQMTGGRYAPHPRFSSHQC